MMAEICCGTCDYFCLEPGKRRSGACMAKWLPDVEVNGVYGAYARSFSFQEPCEDYIEIGKLHRFTPYVIGSEELV